MNIPFWRGKRVLITGHTGFKGSWLSLWLQMLSAELTGYALDPPTSPSLFEIARVGEGMFSVTGDVRDLEHLKMIISERRPEIIIHMAAQSLVRSSYENPIETYETNVLGTANLLEAVRCSEGVRVVIVVTSDKCYENKNTGNFRAASRSAVPGATRSHAYAESEPMGGYDPYSSSKGCAELVTSAYRDSYFNERGIGLATVRAGNVIGGGDWAKNRLMTDIFEGFLNDQVIRIRFPGAVRPWQHVQNPLEGYLLLAEQLWENGAEFSEGWNFGPMEDGERSVEWMVNFMMRAWGSPYGWVPTNAQQPHEAHVLKLDSSKARRRLSWTPRISLERALMMVIEWYKAFQAGEDMQQLTLQQILKNQERIPV